MKTVSELISESNSDITKNALVFLNKLVRSEPFIIYDEEAVYNKQALPVGVVVPIYCAKLRATFYAVVKTDGHVMMLNRSYTEVLRVIFKYVAVSDSKKEIDVAAITDSLSRTGAMKDIENSKSELLTSEDVYDMIAVLSNKKPLNINGARFMN